MPLLIGCGNAPATRAHSPCVTSNCPIQNPRDIVTSTCSSSARRPSSPTGLPIRNRPAGHQRNRIPATVRAAPARIPCAPATAPLPNNKARLVTYRTRSSY